MKISHFAITLILISVIVAGMYGFYFDMAEGYGIDDAKSKEFEAKYNKLDVIAPETENLYANVTGIGSGGPVEYFTGIWDTFGRAKAFVGAIFTIPKDMLRDLTTSLNILPSWSFSAFWAIIIVLISAALLAILVKRAW